MKKSKVEEIRNLRRQGKTYAEIADALNISVPIVQHILELAEKKES